MNYRSIGKNIPRVDAIGKVTGITNFTGDLRFPRELFARIVRSSEPHAVIANIDSREALAIPGIKGVITGEGSTEIVGICIKDQPPIARGKVRFVGEPVAVVVAETKEIALEGSRKVKVDYRPLPAVFECDEAMAADAPLIHDTPVVLNGFVPVPGTNIYHHYKIRQGDVSKAFAQAKFTATGKMHWPHLAHCQLEPHVTIARWLFKDQVEIYTSAQSPFDVRHFIGETFGLPLKNINVTTYCVGGGFGGKSDVTTEPLAVFVAKHFPGEYVRVQLDREEMFNGTVVGRGLDSEFHVAFDGNGIIQGLQVKYMLNSGGYASYAINIVQPGGIVTSGTYYVPNLEIDAYGVYTNRPLLGAYRAYGHPEAALISEKVIDLIAQRIDLDPIIVRRRNLIRTGQQNSVGQIVRDDYGNLPACMDLVERDLTSYRNQQPEDGSLVRGIGLANLLKAPGMPTNGFSTAIVKFNEDSTATILISGIDMGQGLLTTITQIAAEALQMAVEAIEVIATPATRYTPYDWQTVASRSTWMIGNAVYKAAQQAIEQIKGNAAIGLGLPVADLVYDGQRVYSSSNPDLSIPLAGLMLGYTFTNGRTCGSPPLGYGAYMPEMEYANADGQGDVAAQWTFGCQGVVLDLDSATGEIFIRLVASALDIGKVINPTLARGQVEGAVVMGIGGAIMESILYDKRGNIRNPEFTDYKIPTPEDVTDIEFRTHFVETADHTMVYGAKCLGEHPIIAIAPAILSAVLDATGLEFDRLPLTAETVRAKICANHHQVMKHIESKRGSHVPAV